MTDLDPQTTVHKIGRWVGEILAGMAIGVGLLLLVGAGYGLYLAIQAVAS